MSLLTVTAESPEAITCAALLDAIEVATRLMSYVRAPNGRPQAALDAARLWAAEPTPEHASAAKAAEVAAWDCFHEAASQYRQLRDTPPADYAEWSDACAAAHTLSLVAEVTAWIAAVPNGGPLGMLRKAQILERNLTEEAEIQARIKASLEAERREPKPNPRTASAKRGWRTRRRRQRST